MKRHLVLVGLPGSGKTTVGCRVAELLGAPFTDLDDSVTTAASRPVTAIFSQLGEPAFRALERAAMDVALAAPPQVIAPGAGWAAQPDNLETAERAGAAIVYLRVMIAEAIRRIAGDGGRPLLAGHDTEATLRGLFAERERYYLRAALTVDADGPVHAVAETVALRARERAGW